MSQNTFFYELIARKELVLCGIKPFFAHSLFHIWGIYLPNLNLIGWKLLVLGFFKVLEIPKHGGYVCSIKELAY